MKRSDLPNMSNTAKLFLVLAGTVFIRYGTAHADEVLKFRTINHATNVQTIEVGDTEGHILGVSRYSGLASFPDGATATTYFTAIIDYTKGVGTNATYTNITYEDGSALWLKTAGTAAPEGTKALFKGTVDVIGGKGKYAGATGSGTFVGARLAPLATGADLYTDITINLKKVPGG